MFKAFNQKKQHELRLNILNPAGMTPEDEIFVEALSNYPPNTKLASGDLVLLEAVPHHLHGQGPYPNIWEIRAVYSRWQLAFYNLMHQTGGMHDFSMARMEVARHLSPNRYHEPVVYAHAFPHGEWPSSAEWFPGSCLRKLVLQAPTVDWEPILDEFSTPFQGYDLQSFGTGIVFDLAPDIYGDQRKAKRPLVFEEDTFHRACFLGLEEACMVPATSEKSYERLHLPRLDDVSNYDIFIP